jgi:hypothetical protein
LNANDERSLAASARRREARSHRRMKLGRHDYEQSVIPVAMPDQLGVPLRLLKVGVGLHLAKHGHLFFSLTATYCTIDGSPCRSVI